ncbi:MAG: hypothetical protein ACJAS3_000981 [Roseivirga sp.]|jgi:hypothetical protein
MGKISRVVRHAISLVFACLLSAIALVGCKSVEQNVNYSEVLKSVLSESDILISNSILYPLSYGVNIEEIEKK